MITLEFELSESSIQQLTKNLTDWATKVESVKNDILIALADYAKERVQYYIEQTTGNGITGYVPTGELLNSIQISQIVQEGFSDVISVFTDNAYAEYVEFGTGIRGANSPHPDPSLLGKEWNYGDITGQPAHKFMYQAYLDLRANYMEIAKTVLKQKGLI